MIGNLVGNGTYSKVYVEYIEGHGVVAVKESRLHCPLWKKLPKHKNLLSLARYEKIRGRHVYYTEYCENGDLFDLVQRAQRLPEDTALFYLRSIASGLRAMHTHGFAHRDIKLENILLDSSYNPLICDFDFCVEGAWDSAKHHSRCGSIPYCAPEVLMRAEHDPRRADCWSLGVLLYAMVTGCLPFDTAVAHENTDQGIIRRILNNSYTVPQFVSPILASIIRGLLNPNPERRLCTDDILVIPRHYQTLSTDIKTRIEGLLGLEEHVIGAPSTPLLLHSSLDGGHCSYHHSAQQQHQQHLERYTLSEQHH